MRIVLLGLMFPLLLTLGCSSKPELQFPCFWGVALEGYPITAAQLEKVEQEMGFRPAIVLFYLQWPAPGEPGAFPRASLEAIWQQNAAPCLTWEPMYYRDGKEVMVLYEEIAAGRYDAYLTAFARQAAAWGKPFIIRLAHEMNLKRYHWGTDQDHYGSRSPEIYQQLFRYVVDIFRKEGARQVLWAFCPNAESLPNPARDPAASWNQARNYYPGDDYVDLLGMDGYNWGTTQAKDKNGWQSRWQSFQEIFAPLHRELRELAPRKPLLVFETASASQGGYNITWIKEAMPVLEAWKVQGLIWFQVNKEVDWRLQTGLELSCLPFFAHQSDTAKQWLQTLIRK
jgi:hypothetical protein